MSSHRGKCGHFTTYRTKRGQFKLCGIFIVIIVTCYCRRLLNALIATATATLQNSSAEWFTKTKEENWSHARFKEQEKLTNQMEKVHCLLRYPCGHVGSDNIANVFRNGAKTVQNGQRHHCAIHLALQLNLSLVPTGASFFHLSDFPGSHQRTSDGKKCR